MPRKPDAEAPFRISIHKCGHYTYASTQPCTIDPESGRRIYRYIHWGTLDADLIFHPGKTYLFASPEERNRLVFPKTWDLSEIEKLSGKRKPGRPVIKSQDENRLYGDIWLLEQVADTTGLRQDLLETFQGNQEKVHAVLTLAYFLLCGKGTYNQVPAWQRIAKTPYTKPLTSPYITHLTQQIGETERMTLVRQRAARLQTHELCAVDSTSRSAWGDSLAGIRYGRNKDHMPLPQTLEVVVYTLDRHMPVYYRTFPGNVPDSRSLETILNDLKNANFRKVVLITDRGYESVRNLELYIDCGQPMIMGTKVGQKHVRAEIEAFGTFDHHPEGMEIDAQERLYYCQRDLVYQIEGQRGNVKQVRNLKLNLYFDPVRRSHELMDLDVAIREQGLALKQIQAQRRKLDDDATLARAFCYYKLEYNNRLLTSFSLNERKVARKKREAGFFANTTLGVEMDPPTAQRHYKLRDEQEKYFHMMKGLLGARTQQNWSEGGKAGRLLVLFVAQILGCYVSYVRRSRLGQTFHSVAEVLNEMRPIRFIEHPNRKPFVTPFVGRQVEICEAFGFEIPEGCSPDYVVRKTNKGKRGRPRKNKIVIKDK